ncbi:ATP-grasp domain-containing protein [Desulfobacula toluolica]|uniref:ATP-grasp domain-containing protein n=1 Tax=Desulfobacula toluolica TaxID=28223 RepID=UPI00059D1747|nr:ATP-grasp domain-containing protein [Desulfobacula toluolica]
MKKMLPVHNKKRVLVVGTTSDYIEWIRTACPNRALFLTDPEIRKNAQEDSPKDLEELLIPLNDFNRIKTDLLHHLKTWGQTLTGVACFDCESMETAALIASEFGLIYPDLYAIRNCRDKYVSKQLWQKNNIPCPLTAAVNSVDDVARFLDLRQKEVVLKPFFGSGSELVFRCKTLDDCKKAFMTIKAGLKRRCENPLFKKTSSQDDLMLAEEFLDGPEYSCDFIIENNVVTIIRLTRKIKPDNRPFGTVSGYVIPSDMPEHTDKAHLENILLNSAKCLGIRRGLCMVDFIINDYQPVLIEMTPRPGGDCLPFLLKEAGNLDILKLTLDFAEKKPLGLNGTTHFTPHIGIRLHAHKAGVLKRFNTDLLQNEKRIKKIHFTRKPGHIITMPPDDYDSWFLGHMIIAPDHKQYPETQCFLIGKRLGVEIE